jgi:selenocysteine-specific elongation factor
MKNIIVGTAGHIDHGKTALVGALTGIDTDRLGEEKARGISIDLGFAHLEDGNTRLGFVDVPGHERFVKNMLAGATGIDLVLLVVAADESLMPQTREHFEICRLLGLQAGVVALNKCDLVDDAMLALAREDVASYVAGTFLDGAPIVAVSARTGAGLGALRAALLECAARVAPRDEQGLLRLPIDRRFSLRGHGTVVTGTLASGRLRAGMEVEELAGARRLRVRGVQVHGVSVEAARAGERTAVNLAAVEAAELRRGLTLVEPDTLRLTHAVDCRFELLKSAAPLKHRAPIHLHVHTSAVEAEVRLLEGLEPLRPGSAALVRLMLREPLPLVPGDRVIARMFSPVVTIGGGIVIENTPELRVRRAAAAERLRQLETCDLSERLALCAARGIALGEAVARCGATPERIRQAAAAAGLVALRGESPVYATQAAIAREALALRERVAAFHARQPLLAGLPRTQAGLAPAWLEAVLEAAPELVAAGEILRLSGFKVRLAAAEDEASARLEALYRDAGLAAPSEAEALAACGVDAVRARTLLQLLLRSGALVRVSAELICHRDALAGLAQLLAAHRHESFTVAQFKQWSGVSRKYAIPLIEYFDRLHVTRRNGDVRVVA